MKVKEIKAILKPLGILQGVNLYRDEPTQLYHLVSVEKGKGQEAVDALNQAGGKAMRVPGCGGVYSDPIQVER
jgi:hypothetical protein